MGLWIRQGTASCENGATSVSGGSTPWNAVVRAGDGFHFLGDDEVYEIASDADANTAIELVLPYAGETKTDAPYEILPISIRRQEIASLALRVDTLLQGLATLINTTGKPADTTGANGTLAIDEDARLMYKKTDGVWDNGTSIGGPGYGGASTTSQEIQTGAPITFDFPSGYAWVAGGRIRAIAVGSDPLAWMEGPISAYGSGELSFTPDLMAGSGTFESWEFSAAGERGGTGAPGSDGEDGVDGWSPVFAVTADGARDVLKVVDWTGGTGTKPATGKYVGATGFVDLIANGVDLRGLQGDPGEPGDQGPAGLTLRGEYDDDTTYNANDIVVNEGSAWRAKTTTTGVSPPSLPTTSNDSFELFAAKGDKGDPGDPGEPGADGTDGTNFSPDAVGDFVDRSTYDGEASGFCFLSLDGDGDAISTGVLFFKQSATSGDWSTPVLFQGPVGPAGIRWIDGDYNDASSYAVNDALRDQNAAWRCKLATSGGNPPPTLPTASNAYWELLAGAGVSDYNDLSNKPTLGTSSALDVDTDTEMAADSDDLVPSQKAVRAFVGSKVANVFAYQTSWDASAGSFPGAGSAKVGQTWRCSVAGTVDGVSFTVGDLVAAIADNASTTTYAANWDKFESSLSSSEIIAALNAGAIAYSKIQNVSATDKLLGRSSAGAGPIEEIACNSLGRQLLNSASQAALRQITAAPMVPGYRLTLRSGDPAMNGGDVTAGTTIYYTPYFHSFLLVNIAGVWTVVDGADAEFFQALSDTTKSPAASAAGSGYDMFLWSDSSTFRCTRGPAWSSTSARGTGAGTTELTRNSVGLLVNKYAITNGPAAGYGLYVGSVYVDGSSVLLFKPRGRASGGFDPAIHLWNMFNRIPIPFSNGDNGSPYTYNSTTVRQCRASGGNRVRFFRGQDEDAIYARFGVSGAGDNSSNRIFISLAFDSTSVADFDTFGQATSLAQSVPCHMECGGGALPGIGWHHLIQQERTISTTACTLYPTDGNLSGITTF